jgi:hypothetical protein
MVRSCRPRSTGCRAAAAPLEQIVERDFPFLGTCYGSARGVQQGGAVDRTYAEPVGSVRISLTRAGCADPLAAGVPEQFDAFVGHEEACRVLRSAGVAVDEAGSRDGDAARTSGAQEQRGGADRFGTGERRFTRRADRAFGGTGSDR